MRSLIEMRKSEEACRSLYFHFPGEYPQERLVEYIKLRRGRRFGEGRGRGALLQKI